MAEEGEEETIRRPKFRKFQSEAHIPPAFMKHYVPKTEAELRMEERYINGQNRDLKLRHE